MRYGAVITADRLTSRLSQYRKLMNIGDLGIAERVIVNFLRAGVNDIIMITGYNAELLEKSLRKFDIEFIRNEEYETSQMLDSAKMGLRQIKERCDRVFFCPVDVPFFTDQTVADEMHTMDENPDISVIIPSFEGRGGHPILIDCRVLPDILAYDGDRGMKGAYESLPPGSTARAVVDDAGAVIGAETREAYQKLVDLHNDRLMHPQIKLTFATTTSFFGPGSVELLREIDRCGNVREACEKCGFSYSKGWTILKRCEEKSGYTIVERQTGGQNGGAAFVTDKGRDLLAVYDELSKEIEEIAEERFRELMDKHHLTGEAENTSKGKTDETNED